jgi:hypothetical protein
MQMDKITRTKIVGPDLSFLLRLHNKLFIGNDNAYKNRRARFVVATADLSARRDHTSNAVGFCVMSDLMTLLICIIAVALDF